MLCKLQRLVLWTLCWGLLRWVHIQLQRMWRGLRKRLHVRLLRNMLSVLRFKLLQWMLFQLQRSVFRLFRLRGRV